MAVSNGLCPFASLRVTTVRPSARPPVLPPVLQTPGSSSYIGRRFVPRFVRGPTMRLTLLESNRPFLQKAESTFVSLLVHGGVIWFALSATAGGREIPTDAREARVFFLLPPG